MTPELFLEFCSMRDERYQRIRAPHYVSNEGSHGQQLHFLVWYRNRIVGIMSAGTSVYGTRPRDSFFRITERNRKNVLPGIANNSVFRLIYHGANLGTRCLGLWRRVTPILWHDLYNTEIFGFETFVEEAHNVAKEKDETFSEEREVIDRDGTVYRADNWRWVGTTSGSTKRHLGLNQTSRRKVTCKKLVYCRWRKGFDAPLESDYLASWKAHTAWGTPEEKRRATELTKKRKAYEGTFFCCFGERIVTQAGASLTTRAVTPRDSYGPS